MQSGSKQMQISIVTAQGSITHDDAERIVMLFVVRNHNGRNVIQTNSGQALSGSLVIQGIRLEDDDVLLSNNYPTGDRTEVVINNGQLIILPHHGTL